MKMFLTSEVFLKMALRNNPVVLNNIIELSVQTTKLNCQQIQGLISGNASMTGIKVQAWFDSESELDK